MGIFCRRKSKDNSWASEAREKLQWEVASGLHKLQHCWAEFMHRHTECLSRKGRVIMLCCFTVLGSAYCGMLIWKGFIDKDTDRPELPRIQTSTPMRVDIAPSIEKREILRVLQFKRHLDSMARSPDPNNYYRDLMRRRPGLMDSLIAFEMLHDAVKPNAGE